MRHETEEVQKTVVEISTRVDTLEEFRTWAETRVDTLAEFRTLAQQRFQALEEHKASNRRKIDLQLLR